MARNGLKNPIGGLESMFRAYPTKEKESQTPGGQYSATNMELIDFFILKKENKVRKT
jgi:hypothetical protein